MISAGDLVDEVKFYRRNATADAYGNPSSGYEVTPYLTRRCQFRTERARERMEAGRLEASAAGIIRLRREDAVMAISPADKVEINGTAYQIRSDPLTNGRRDRVVEFNVERGVAI